LGGPSGAHNGVSLTGLGTATIDGVISPGEWDGAAGIGFMANVSGGTPVAGTLRVMNDWTNLYLAVTVAQPMLGSTAFRFDNNHDGSGVAIGDDNLGVGFGVSPAGSNPLADGTFSNLGGCPSGFICGFRDTQLGGTTDGTAAVHVGTTDVTYEISHPLDSADDAHDFSLKFGDTVGVLFQVVTRNAAGTSLITQPFGSALLSDIVIATPPPDTTKPTISATVTPPPNANGWNGGGPPAPMVTYTAHDEAGGSGVQSITCSSVPSFLLNGPATVSSSTRSFFPNGLVGSFTCTAKDNAGNVSDPFTQPFQGDGFPPTITFLDQSPPPNANGWNKSDVTVTWTCVDGPNPLFSPNQAPFQGISGAVSPSVSQTVTTEGDLNSTTGICTDLAGNTSMNTRFGISLDKTAPFAPTAAADRSPDFLGGGGWYKDAVTVSFASNGDSNGSNGAAGSGVDPASVPRPVTFTSGRHTVTGTVKDLAGNESPAASVDVQVDAESPGLAASFANRDGTAYTPGTLTNQDVTVTFSCDDGDGSGVASFSPPLTLATEGVGQSVPGSCTDNVGHLTSLTFGPINIDKTAPSIAPHGDVHVTTANPHGTDVDYGAPPATDNIDGSDAVFCVPAPGSHFDVGHTTVTCSASDRAGNQVSSFFDVFVELTGTPADLGAFVGSLGLDRGLGNDLQNKAREAGDFLARARLAQSCDKLDQFAVRVLDELGKPNSKLTTEQAQDMLALLYAVEATQHCTLNASLPAAEQAIVMLLGTIDALDIDNGLANDLSAKAADAGRHAAMGDDNPCAKLADLTKRVTAETGRKLTASQAVELKAEAAEAQADLGC
jgi:hypothetical protein